MAGGKNILLDVENTTGKRQRRPFFKRKRGGMELTREQVKAIKRGRKELRKELKSRGMKDKEDFKLMASGMGLYFDSNSVVALFQWLFHGMGLAVLGGVLGLFLLVTFLYASMTQLRGHFTINMSDGMFREGFILSETEDFRNPTTHLFCQPAVDVPCISISHIPDDIDNYEGQHNENYFAYTFFLRNEGESTVDYYWSMDLTAENKELSSATWVMIFQDGEMAFFAAPDENGEPQVLPARDDNARGFLDAPLSQFCKDPDSQYEVIAHRDGITWYRVIPISFVNDKCVFEGKREAVEPMEVHKYTVVIWLEGDDPDCNDELIGGHVGMEINMVLAGSETDTADGTGAQKSHWNDFWDNLKFWQG